MTHPFAGIEEKLKRSNENVLNLKAEVDRFFEEGKYPVIPKHDKKLITEAIEYHQQRKIPLRFSVLVGEIVHHLRSILDHIAWHFSSPEYRNGKKTGRYIEFPILETRPRNENSSTVYDRKIEGINDAAVCNLIEALQPYNSPDPFDCPLLIIHNMDVFDKHRELVLCHSTGGVVIPPAMRSLISEHAARHQSGHLDPSLVTNLGRQIKNHAQFIPTISFRDFGRRQLQPVIPALTQLHNYIVGVAEQFANRLPRID